MLGGASSACARARARAPPHTHLHPARTAGSTTRTRGGDGRRSATHPAPLLPSVRRQAAREGPRRSPSRSSRSSSLQVTLTHPYDALPNPTQPDRPLRGAARDSDAARAIVAATGLGGAEARAPLGRRRRAPRRGPESRRRGRPRPCGTKKPADSLGPALAADSDTRDPSAAIASREPRPWPGDVITRHGNNE